MASPVTLEALPPCFIVRTDEKAPLEDGYPAAALREVLAVYHRAAKSVMRTHIFEMALRLTDKASPVEPEDDWDPKSHRPVVEDLFWEHAETAYIRLASYWDRIGQVLDFAFFNIRKFDQNGFDKVMHRLAANVTPMSPALQKSSSYLKLREFANSEKADGFKWLVQRRNLLVHSLHLHPLEDQTTEVFDTQFNHLEQSYRLKLKPGSPFEESQILSNQLNQAARLFIPMMEIIKRSPDRKVDEWTRK